MADPHEMRMVNGHIRAVYTDGDGREYIIIDSERVYLTHRSPTTGDDFADGYYTDDYEQV